MSVSAIVDRRPVCTLASWAARKRTRGSRRPDSIPGQTSNGGRIVPSQQPPLITKRFAIVATTILIVVFGGTFWAYQSSVKEQREFWDQMFTTCMSVERFGADLESEMNPSDQDRSISTEGVDRCREEANQKVGPRP